MKPKLGPNVIMRLKFDFTGSGLTIATSSTGGNGYSKLSGTDDDGPKSIQMVSFATRTATETATAVDVTTTDAATSAEVVPPVDTDA